MSGHRDDYPRWVAIDEDVVARVEGGDVTGLLIYGQVNAERLRQVRLKRLSNIAGTSQASDVAAADEGTIAVPHAFPEWAQEHPPTASEVREQASKRTGAGRPGRLVPTGHWRPTAAQKALIIEAATKRPSEGAADFYRRFAAMVQEISPWTESPNQVIAQVLGVSPDVVKQYIHRARRIGALPPARRTQHEQN